MLKPHEIIGSELPIIEEKQLGMFTYQELVYLQEEPRNYQVAGFIKGTVEDLFIQIYTKKE